MLLGLAIVPIVIWLGLLLARGGFWRMPYSEPKGTLPAPSPRVVAVIPARNEEAVIGRAIQSLVAQEYPSQLEIVVVDDGSTDGTAAAAQRAAPAGLLTIMRAAPLPPGWTGKVWALAEGIHKAQEMQPDYFLLTDADIVHPRDNLASLVVRAESGGYDLVSYMATLHCRSFAERALIPAFVLFFFMLYPPAWVRSKRRTTAGAAGGCMLIRRSRLERIGGVAAIANDLIDDCALAREVKQGGGRVWLGLSPETRSIREYAGFGEIGNMISRSAFTQLRHSSLLLAGTILAMTITYFVPPVLTIYAACNGPSYLTALGGFGWLMMLVACFPVLRYYRVSPFWALLLPLIAAFYLGATVDSAVAHWRGRGGLWKGRTVTS
ncbi:MAG TPA: glycosyltransferase [Bryobacteraceae bacterium]|nr:glycosyltransferase [Bryobacteraceae bacterium]